jgi:hypothetical protein
LRRRGRVVFDAAKKRSAVENGEVTMRYALTVAFVGILSLAAAVALADDTVRLASGTRVRVTVPTGGGRLVGTVLALDDKNLTLQVPGKTDTAVLRREDITELFVSAGRRSRGRGALIGAAIGAGAGALIGLAAGSDDRSNFIRFSAGQKAVLFGIVLAPIGALVGAAGHPAERWKELPKDRIRLSLAPVSGRGAAVSLAFVF